jgi:hypothetical protein
MDLDSLALEQANRIHAGLRTEKIDQTSPEKIDPGRLFGVLAAACFFHGGLLLSRHGWGKVVRPIFRTLRRPVRFVNVRAALGARESPNEACLVSIGLALTGITGKTTDSCNNPGQTDPIDRPA